MKQTTEPFEELIIPRRELQASVAMVYRIYSDYKNFDLVEASSALEALSISKNKNVYKIQRYDPLDGNIIHLNQAMRSPVTENIAVKNNIDVAPIQLQVKELEVPTEQVSVVPASIEAAPLSNDDIDKLLNG